MKINAIWIALLLLAGCTRPVVVRDRIERVSVPVATGCVDGDIPAPFAPLSTQILPDAWVGLTPKQKAAHVGRQALRHQSRGEAIAAATAGCK